MDIIVIIYCEGDGGGANTEPIKKKKKPRKDYISEN